MKKRNDNVEMFHGAVPMLFEFATNLRLNETPAEKALWEKLKNKQVSGLKFRRQHPIKYFIADFYCHSERLIIELDGGIHLTPEEFEYDINRDYELNTIGIKVMRFKNEEVFKNINLVIEKIKQEIKGESSPHP